ncbi:MAG: hypothetical protein JWM14_2546 [Chitinophagaceae bacterium]|nr:hypothetical protein [Chitinophagaceae bacterium]
MFTALRFLLLLAVLFPLSLQAQEGSLDLTFNALDQVTFGDGKGTNDKAAFCSAITSDNKLLVAGDFPTYNGTTVGRLIRINMDGSLDPSFNAGTGPGVGEIRKIILLSSGKFFIVGNFTAYNGNTVPGIARINADGSFDASFSLGSTAPNFPVQAAELLPDGKLIISGQFTTINGTPKKYIARILEDGALDPSFEANLTQQQNVKAVQSNGKLLINFNSTITRLNADGSPDATFTTIGVQSSYYPGDLLLLPNDKFLLTFSGAGNKIVGYTSEGIVDPSFQQGSFSSGGVYSWKVRNDNKIVVAGTFSFYGPSNRSKMMLLNTDGTADLSFNQPTTYTYNHLSILSDDKLLVSHSTGIVLLSATGGFISNFKNTKGADAPVNVVIVQPDDKIILGGQFSSYNQKQTNNVVRITSDGNIDPTFNSLINGASVESINLQPDGKLIVAGSFNSPGNPNLRRLNADGSFDPSFFSSALGVIYASKLQSDGKILIGGTFTYYGPDERKGIARLNADGSIDNTFIPPAGFTGIVNAIALQSDGKILVAGTIACSSSQFPTKYNFLRLNTDGSVDQSFKSGTGIESSTYKIAVGPDDKIIVGGSGILYNGVETGHYARLNPDGSIDKTFIKNIASYPPQPSSVYIQSDGKILMQVLNSNFFRLNSDGSIDNSFIIGVPNGSSPYNSGPSAGVASDGSIYYGGSFGTYNGIIRNSIAKINGSHISDYCKYFQLYFKDVSDINCIGNGPTATAQAFGGTAPYQYDWTTPVQTGATVSLTTGGIYTAHVTDAKGCSANASLLITDPLISTQADLTNNFVATTLRKGFTSTFTINALNQGCASASGKLKLVLNNFVTYMSATPTPINISGDTLIWNVSNLVYGGALFQPVVTIQTTTSAVVGQQLCFPVIITSTVADANPDNNIKKYCLTVFNSYDPNDKQVYPIGACNQHYITNDQPLTYTLRFQNTGNSSAINVIVSDTISAGLDLSTARVISHSHPVITEVVNNNILKFHFDNIQLPTATANESASKGYVVFEISPISNSTTDILINNKVNIYFDYNDPITTNTVFNTLTNSIPTVDASVVQAGDVLTANTTSASYQWYNCSTGKTDVSGATNQSFTIPVLNTNYGVRVGVDGCTAESDCFHKFQPVIQSTPVVLPTTTYTYGQTSPYIIYRVGANELFEDITVSVPTDFSISTDSVNFSSAVTIVPVNGKVNPSQKLYIRLDNKEKEIGTSIFSINHSTEHGTNLILPCTLVVNKAPIHVYVTTEQRYQSEPNPTFQLTYQGFVNNDDESVLDELPTTECYANENSTPGPYTVYVFGGSDNHYQFDLHYGTLNVLIVTSNNTSSIIDNYAVVPNPASQSIRIKSIVTPDISILSDLSGNVIGNYHGSTIDISTLADGMYILTTWFENTKATVLVSIIHD